MKMRLVLTGMVLLVMAFYGCSSTPNVSRISADTQVDVSGYWNDTDLRLVCESLIKDCLSSPRIAQTMLNMGGKTPVVLVGRFRNESDEHIDTAIISRTMEQAIFNTGRMDFIAGGSTRDELRMERLDQMDNASEATAAALGNEIGADFMLTGSVRTIVDRAGNLAVRTYFVNAEMTSIETNQRMWMGQDSQVKKVITRPRNRL